MSDDWQPGDLALCIKQGAWLQRYEDGSSKPGYGPRAGQMLTVRAVGVGVNGQPSLKFIDFPDRPHPRWLGYSAARFRKLRPHTPDAEDAETIALLKGGRVPA